jgi:hypothetical protein
MLSPPAIQRAALEATVARFESWATYAGLSTALLVAIAAACSVAYLYQRLRLGDLGREEDRRQKLLVERLEAAALFFTALAAVVGLVGAISTIGYVWNNRKLQVFQEQDISEARQSAAVALEQENAIKKENRILDQKLTETQRQQLLTTRELAATVNDLSTAKTRLDTVNRDLAARRKAEEAAEQIRRTPPNIDVHLASSAVKEKLTLYINCGNLVPFEFRAIVVTENNIIVTGLPLGMTKVFPKKGRQLFNDVLDLHIDQVRDGFLELQVDYASLSAEDLRLQGLKGKIVKRYHIEKDGVTLTSLD